MRAIAILLTTIAITLVGPAPSVSQTGVFLGIRLQDMSESLINALTPPVKNGILVRDVVLDSPAARAGLMRSDVLTQINGKPLQSIEDAFAALAGLSPGESVTVEVRRQDKPLSLTLVLEPVRESLRIDSEKSATLRTQGLTLAALSPKIRERFSIPWGTTGLLISRVDAARKKVLGHDLIRGEVIVKVGQDDVWLPDHVLSRLAAAKEAGQNQLLLLVWGVGGYRFSLLPID